MGLHKVFLYVAVAFWAVMALQHGWQEATVLLIIGGVPLYMVFRGLGLGR